MQNRAWGYTYYTPIQVYINRSLPHGLATPGHNIYSCAGPSITQFHRQLFNHFREWETEQDINPTLNIHIECSRASLVVVNLPCPNMIGILRFWQTIYNNQFYFPLYQGNQLVLCFRFTSSCNSYSKPALANHLPHLQLVVRHHVKT